MNIQELEVYTSDKQKLCYDRILNFKNISGKDILAMMKKDIEDFGVENAIDVFLNNPKAKEWQACFQPAINKEYATICYNAMLYIKSQLK